MVTAKVGKRHALTGYEALRELFISRLGMEKICLSTIIMFSHYFASL